MQPAPDPARPAPAGLTGVQSPQGPAGPRATPAPPSVPDEPPRHVRGPRDAPVLLEEYSDFQCPQCARMHTIVKELQAKYPSQLRVGFRHLPLQSIHRYARESARAAEAAGAQGRFWEMHDLLYQNQEAWSKANPARPLFVAYAQSLGLDAARFQQDIDSSTVSMKVVSDERRAAMLRVGGTPAFFVNGRELKFDDSNTLEKLSAAVERALAEQKK
ncbi:MAG: DsbA family protein [Acidobacteria bacterium]|nr:DsbA family protein [Acidobacteriota bacterium]